MVEDRRTARVLPFGRVSDETVARFALAMSLIFSNEWTQQHTVEPESGEVGKR